MSKARDPGIGRKVLATVTDLKGKCSAGHEIGDKFNLSCHNPDGLCGFFYHDIFPRLSVLQYGGRYPWWTQGQTVFEYQCPDKNNLVTLKLEVSEDRTRFSGVTREAWLFLPRRSPYAKGAIILGA